MHVTFAHDYIFAMEKAFFFCKVRLGDLFLKHARSQEESIAAIRFDEKSDEILQSTDIMIFRSFEIILCFLAVIDDSSHTK